MIERTRRNNYLAVGLTVVVLLLTCFEQQVKAQTLSAADVDIGWTLLNGALVMCKFCSSTHWLLTFIVAIVVFSVIVLVTF